VAGGGTRDHPDVSFARSRAVFLRLLGVVYALAFASLAVQITGLVGEHGILPVGTLLDRAHAAYGAAAYGLWPTLVWLSPTDTALTGLAWGGVLLSALLVAGIAPVATAALLWACYLSLAVAGQVFLQFQWDALLLETGLLAVLYAPLVGRSRLDSDPEPPPIVRWVLWLLAFKLTLLSGVTKIVSGDPSWATWTALQYHYETQPIPAWTSWYAHQLPAWVHAWSAGGMFAVELVVPWLIFLPTRFRRLRLAGCVAMILLQVGIAVTGNYGFFNLLTVVLYLSLLDDRTLARVRPLRASHRAGDGQGGSVAWRLGVSLAACAVAVMSGMTIVREIDRTAGRQGVFDRGIPARALAAVAPVRSINGYGLFRVMTTDRPEIVIEVSEDGQQWQEQEFRWKAGDVTRRPRFVEPHMPRLDWQMWFAALDPSSAAEWLLPLVDRLLDREEAVTTLLEPSPLAGPPGYARLAYYQYRFSSAAERADTGAWWTRERIGLLTGPIARDDRNARGPRRRE